MTNQSQTKTCKLRVIAMTEDSLKETMADPFQEKNRAGDTAEQLEVELTNSELVILWLFMAILIIAGVVAGFLLWPRDFP